MLTQPFLTDLDSRAAIKGSRDPLGVQWIWSRFGRYVVGNLTTVSSSLRDFTSLLLGYHFVERVADGEKGEGDLATFMKWEQLAAYARGEINKDWDFRGTERARRNLNESSRVRLSAGARDQILSDQKHYGLWGLYTVAARASGLLEGEPTRLTAAGRELVEKVYLPLFTRAGLRDGDAIVEKLCQKVAALDVRGGDRALLKAVAKVLDRRVFPQEHHVYRDHLLFGGPRDTTAGVQTVLAAVLAKTVDDKGWRLSASCVRELAKQAKKYDEKGAALAERLERIRTCELLLAPAVVMFDFLLRSDGQTVTDVAKAVRSNWGASLRTIDLDATTELERELCQPPGDVETAARWMQIARTLSTGAYEDAINLLLKHNRAVMKLRSAAAPWIDVRDRKLQVRFRGDEPLRLPKADELPEHWRHPYFIDSLRMMAHAVRE